VAQALLPVTLKSCGPQAPSPAILTYQAPLIFPRLRGENPHQRLSAQICGDMVLVFNFGDFGNHGNHGNLAILAISDQR
jgi:hypothetical protein